MFSAHVCFTQELSFTDGTGATDLLRIVNALGIYFPSSKLPVEGCGLWLGEGFFSFVLQAICRGSAYSELVYLVG